jgi:hypothetical protein
MNKVMWLSPAPLNSAWTSQGDSHSTSGPVIPVSRLSFPWRRESTPPRTAYFRARNGWRFAMGRASEARDHAYRPEDVRGAGIRPLISIDVTHTASSASTVPVTLAFKVFPGSTVDT